MSNYIDLTYTIEEGMTTFPSHWHPMVEVSILGRHGIENRETRKLVIGTHTGTHCDAPRHFIPRGTTLDQAALSTFIGPAGLLDFSKVAPKQELTVKDFQRALRNHRYDRLVLRFDWSDYWGTRRFYSDHPFLSEAAADWLVKRGVKLLGMDTPMPDNPCNGWQSDNDSPVHKIFLGRGVVLVEYLCNLRKVKRRNFDLIVLPLKVLDADGAPARAVARIS